MGLERTLVQLVQQPLDAKVRSYFLRKRRQVEMYGSDHPNLLGHVSKGLVN